ncbi:MAG: bifunctional UDP-N-acetylglucosamine diphosphorylase/glucosamine-1-phosphate N-acetyltransferase GlmU [Limnochordia bacterium]|jgi:bifunctional UDP-N-acetylglucosamine pyrophosphorylase/glucosamine-1-phosphate N-acetyltransferase
MGLAAVILAAGRGTRMRSKKAKVLHELCGLPMISHVIRHVEGAGVDRPIVILGYQGEAVQRILPEGVEVRWQREQLGTGHAVQQAEDLLADDDGTVLVIAGDTPLITSATIARLVEHHCQRGAQATILTAEMEDPFGYGRILRDPTTGNILGIVEEGDASPEERRIREVNTGTYCFASRQLFQALQKIDAHNSQGEYYLTDVIDILVREGAVVAGWMVEDPQETIGINDRLALAQGEAILRDWIRRNHLANGVTMLDPASTFIDVQVEIGPDTILYPGVILEGNTTIGEESLIGPRVRIVDSRLGSGVQVSESTLMECRVGDGATIGPYAYIRPGSDIGPQAKVGDFVELKNCQLGAGSKVPHLSYVGDAVIGKGVNIGAGVITCNYDGKNKHVTIVEDGAFVGSNSNLVAPVTIGSGAYVAAGSTITKEVPPDSLGIARARQSVRENWAKERRQKEQG